MDAARVARALNRQGIFFERWCASIVRSTPGWIVKNVAYPVEHPIPAGVRGRIRKEESSLDIRAESRHSGNVLTMPIECKRHMPTYAEWIFFRAQPKREADIDALVR